ncbi:sulfur oxidation c-type cytochrome SoxA [Halorhodospira neutriphila]|uniref:L-cysteine S-thiosulfotransferase subunit SoxA n=1 Tax=Halorhodospira neutriphila TaxID=168379 RepID=A0ABS1E4H7_9GAMM|nr:sulfur oxidation c-type cytochrome SoxA [Halorhodospira neutriphila]MBK1726042.1 sulfur oxidation c-type cytochrome SoxA [Halorhodospira neutriphila]
MHTQDREIRRGAAILVGVVIGTLSHGAALGEGSDSGSAAERDYATSATWDSYASKPSLGRTKEVDGERIQRRYDFGGFARIDEDYSEWPTHAYNDDTEYPEPQRVSMPEGLEGDPQRGKELFMDRSKGPCSSCHLVPESEVWPAGSVGTDLRTVGSWERADDEWLYQMIYDPRPIYGEDTPMPPFGVSGILSEQEIADLVSYLQTLTGSPEGEPVTPAGVDQAWNPYKREAPSPAYGDPLDVFNNPALMKAENIAVPLWRQEGPNGESCAGCHGEIGPADERRPLGVIEEMVGVAAEYPKWYEAYNRMMSIEDFLAVHAEETMDMALPTQSRENKYMSLLVHSQSNGMAYDMDLDNPNVQAAIERGRKLFHKEVGRRGHSCAECHTSAGGGGDFLGGRRLDNIEADDTLINHPYWRTAQNRLWDIRTRFQWCMTPVGTNYLPGDSPEYADLETYIMSKQQGHEILVPRIAH